MKKSRKPNGQFSTQEPAWNPTPEEIAAACLEVQKGWSEYDFARRQGKRVMPHPQASQCRGETSTCRHQRARGGGFAGFRSEDE